MVMFDTTVKIDYKDDKWIPEFGEHLIVITSSNFETYQTKSRNEKRIMDKVMKIPIETTDGRKLFWHVTISQVKDAEGNYRQSTYAQLAKLETEHGSLVNKTLKVIVTPRTGDSKSYFITLG